LLPLALFRESPARKKGVCTMNFHPRIAFLASAALALTLSVSG
jgi:hypothetical protein